MEITSFKLTAFLATKSIKTSITVLASFQICPPLVFGVADNQRAVTQFPIHAIGITFREQYKRIHAFETSLDE